MDKKYERINLDIEGVDPFLWLTVVEIEDMLTNIMMKLLLEHRIAKLPIMICKN